MDRRNSAKKMTLAKRVVENLGTTNNLNPRGLCRSAQPEIVPEIMQKEDNLNPGEEATSEASNQPTHNFKRRRGPNKCKVIATENYLRRPLEYNLLGQPVGEDSVGYNTYLGIIVKEVVPITFVTWHDVENEFRRQQKFIVPDEARKLALMTMGKDWREHKVQKRKVIDIKDDLEQALANFPEDVPYDQWDVFAEQCTTSEYKETRRKHIDVKKNHKLPHACSRLGYPRLEHKMPNQISAQDETTLPESNRLASLTPSNVVATCHWYNVEPTCKVHNVPLGIGMSKVSIKIALKEDVPLARGNDHLKTIGDACGSFVAWPTPFIIKE
ncbi:hypothetical protein GIB67_032054 [Kingdonia uniflora]|uniref:DUF8039 domain-containing protein n=1 Tax=Kingdonia uniflora TaxID=39325 RepID=A0A7J7MWM7_9MAGN|nr:hypothetical protein GIB67_032054 [Kingdonia uniflora]